MRAMILPVVVAVICGGCGNPTPPAANRNVPLPADLGTVDPLIADLLYRTAGAVQADPGNAKLWAQHASALLANAYYEDSLAASQAALSMDENLLHLRYRQAAVLWRLNRQEEAMTDLAAVLEAEPAYDPGWRTMSAWHLQQGDLDAAQAAAIKAWELAPGRSGALVAVIQVLLQQDRPAEAVSLLEPRLEVANVPPYMHHIAAQVYRRLGRTSDMEASLAKAGPLPKRWPDPWLNEIALLATGKRMLAQNAMDMLRTRGPKQALPILRKAVEANPNNADLRAAMSFALQSTGQTSEAVEVLDGLSDNAEPTTNYWKQYASIAVVRALEGDGEAWFPKAYECILRAIQSDPDDPELHDAAARISLFMDMPEAAQEHERVANDLRLNPAIGTP